MSDLIKRSDDCRGGKKLDGTPLEEVVRCKKCRLNETEDCPMVYYNPLEDGGIETRCWNRPDDYCSWGERKTSDEEDIQSADER